MKNLTLIFVFFILLSTTFSLAQNTEKGQRKVFGKTIQNIHPETGIARCVSTEYEAMLQEKHPKRANTEAFEAWIAPKVEAVKKRLVDGRNTNTVITIPVVVHVIHNGDAVGVNENISDERILSQIAVLNQDFRRILGTPGYNTNPVGADVEIEFCMAQRKPDGTPTNGIDRVNLGVANWWTTDDLDFYVKPATIWDPEQYMNIWVAEFNLSLESELSQILGYAQYPDNSNLPGLAQFNELPQSDGVFMEYRCFGSIDFVSGTFFNNYNRGRTTTHEVGHFLGLRHIWGDAGSRSQNILNCNGTDFCNDTPTAGWENYECLTYDSCPAAPGLDMVQNYMDYTDDICMNIFTLDQKARMLAVMENSPRRNTLATSTACQSVLDKASFEVLETVTVFPNPTQDILNISLGGNNSLPENYVIVNSLGQIVGKKSVQSAADLVVPTAHLSAGIYFLTIEKEQSFKTLKFVKK